ncbi:MAG: cupin domain-containing protein [Phycisphaerales bacterium]|nr:MAG: cupin domain-containing protein [Phycisphaerales bacterium]
MAEQRKNDTVLSACLSKAQELGALIDYAQDSIVSKTILSKSVGTITLFAFDQGQSLSEHTSPYDAVVQVLDGTARLTIGGDDKTARAGQLIIMPANVPHSVNAEERFKMLLTMIRA